MNRTNAFFARATALSCLALALSTPGTALADDKPKVQWGGLIFAHYGYLLGEEAEKYNEFDIDRVYLTAKSKLNSDLSIRVTTDMGRAKPQGLDSDGDGEEDTELPEDQKIRVYLKYAYLEWAAADNVKLRFGSAGTGFVGFYDKFWGQRYLSKAFTDDNKILDSADIGIHAVGKVADGLFSWQGSIVNGDGYGSAETSATKALQARMTLDPMAKGDNSLPITAFISQDVMSPDDEDPITVFAGAAGYSMDYLTFWGEYVMQKEAEVSGSGYSVTVMPKIPDVLNIIGRYDHWDPDADTEQDAESTLRAGISRDFFTKISGAVTYERTSFEAEPDTPEHGVFLRMQAGF